MLNKNCQEVKTTGADVDSRCAFTAHTWACFRSLWQFLRAGGFDVYNDNVLKVTGTAPASFRGWVSQALDEAKQAGK